LDSGHIQKPYIDTTTPMGEAMFAISAAWAQLERGIIGEKVKAGMVRAQAEGKSIGRPSLGINSELVVQLRASGMSWAKIGERIHKLPSLAAREESHLRRL
jgi:DNA invertase Pin-like site-specific DNA recombinase